MPADGYHPSLLIDPNQKIAVPSPPVEVVKSTAKPTPTPEKKEIKVAELRVQELKPPVESKSNEVKPSADISPSTHQQQTVQPETFTVATSSHNRTRVASNLPPHLEQQLQQHSMMRNTAPRQQNQGAGAQTGVRMMRSVSGTAWRGAANQQQQQAALQRSISHPGNADQQRAQLPHTTQAMRPGAGIQQIRPTANMVAVNNVQASTHPQQLAQQLPGLVRQVRLNHPMQSQNQIGGPPQQQQQQLGQPSVVSEHAPQDSNQQYRGQMQQPANNTGVPFQPGQRVILNQQHQIVKLGPIQQQQPDGKMQQQQQNIQNQQHQQHQLHPSQGMVPTAQQVPQHYQQSVQPSQPISQQQQQQQHNFQQYNESVVQPQQQVQQQNPNLVSEDKNFAPQHIMQNPRMPMAPNAQQTVQQQQQVTYLSIFLIFDQLIERNVSKGCYAHATDAAAATTAEPPAAKYGRSRRRKLSADSRSKSI